ncbi:MAG: type IV pilin protein [Sedimenticola sp.]
MKNRIAGFTLVELMITVAIIGILASIALPSYRQYVVRSNRVAAQAEMMEIANFEQQYLLANRAYGDETALGYTLSTEVAVNYSYTITAPTATPPGFTINFTAIGGQADDGDLSLDSAGVKTPSDKW